jgi:hypothetical protein
MGAIVAARTAQSGSQHMDGLLVEISSSQCVGCARQLKKKGKHTVLALQVKSKLFDYEIKDRFFHRHLW